MNFLKEKLYKKWTLILLALLLIAPLFGMLKDELGSTEPLDHVAENLGLEESGPFYELLPDYTVPAIGNPYLSTLVAGLIGFAIVLFFTYGISKLLVVKKW